MKIEEESKQKKPRTPQKQYSKQNADMQGAINDFIKNPPNSAKPNKGPALGKSPPARKRHAKQQNKANISILKGGYRPITPAELKNINKNILYNEQSNLAEDIQSKSYSHYDSDQDHYRDQFDDRNINRSYGEDDEFNN